jgi:5'-nucleotidase
MSREFVALVDMDGVVADLEGGLHDYIAANFPKAIRRSDVSNIWAVEEQYDNLSREALTPLFDSERFFLDLPVVEGAIEGVNALAEVAEVFFCSTPTSSVYCGGEKQVWIAKHFPNFKRRLILTKDKTVVRGDILIDDKPEITGYFEPTWKHVLYRDDAFTWANVETLCKEIRTGMV